MRRVASTLLLGLVQTCAFAAAPPPAVVAPMAEGARWCLQAPSPGTVAVHGVDESEAAHSGPDSMLYPVVVPGLAAAFASLAAGIATHGAIVGAVESRQARERAERADHVLEPYRPTLAGVTYERLHAAIRAAHPDWTECGATQEPGMWLIGWGAALLVTQDESTVIAEVSFRAGPQGMTARQRPRETTVRVVSSPLEATELRDRWMAGDGALITEKSAALVVDALEIALRWEAQQAVTATAPYATWRFALGQREHMERAQRISADCHRAILRTLRGQYLSIPLESGDCAPGPAPAQPPAP